MNTHYHSKWYPLNVQWKDVYNFEDYLLFKGPKCAIANLRIRVLKTIYVDLHCLRHFLHFDYFFQIQVNLKIF